MKLLFYFLCITCLFACDDGQNEKYFVELGGEKQYIETTAKSSENPVLLFIHGGPGWPQTPHIRYFNSALSDETILISWDQRGSGQSYIKNPNPQNVTLGQIVNDAHELTLYLKKKFNKDKIYLAGFSWGSIIGMKLVEKYPADYIAYFGISQVTNVRESIRVSREWIKREATSHGDTTALKTLQQIDNGDTSVCKQELDCFFKQYEFLSKYRGAIYKKESDIEIDKAVNAYPDYKTYDWMGAFTFSIGKLQNDLFSTDLTGIKDLKVPVYFFTGRFDWNIPGQLIERFTDSLTAPSKEIIWFEQSGHEPLEEEAQKFNTEMIKRIKQHGAGTGFR